MTTSINALLMFGKVMKIIFNQIPIDLSWTNNYENPLVDMLMYSLYTKYLIILI